MQEIPKDETNESLSHGGQQPASAETPPPGEPEATFEESQLEFGVDAEEPRGPGEPGETDEPEPPPQAQMPLEPQPAETAEAEAVAPVAPEIDAIRAELEDTAPISLEDEAETQAEPSPSPSLADEVAAAAAAAALEAEQLEGEVPVGEDVEAVETWLESEHAESEERPRGNLALTLPFYVYVGIWFVFSITMIFALKDTAQAGTPVYSEAYGIFVFIAIALTVMGPILALVVWLLSRYWAEPGERRGLLAQALLRGAIATFAGVAMWTAALYVLDLFKTGAL